MKQDWVVVTLTDEEMEELRRVARLRNDNAIAKGYVSKAEAGSPVGHNVIGRAGEIAVARFYGLEACEGFMEDVPKGGEYDVGGFIEVTTCRDPLNCNLLKEKELIKKDAVYVNCLADEFESLGVVKIMGWAYAKEFETMGSSISFWNKPNVLKISWKDLRNPLDLFNVIREKHPLPPLSEGDLMPGPVSVNEDWTSFEAGVYKAVRDKDKESLQKLVAFHGEPKVRAAYEREKERLKLLRGDENGNPLR